MSLVSRKPPKYIMSILELQIRTVLEKLSNNQHADLDVDPDTLETYIEEATQEFKGALRKQLFREPEPFRLRMSNIGRPSCQLQLDNTDTAAQTKNPMPYNHIMRMMLGDLSEVLVNLAIKLSGANITGAKTKVSWALDTDTVIEGEDDIEIDNKVYDVKSASPWAYDNKWSRGWSSIASDDNFGYVGQLVGYAYGQNKEPGGWIVVNKSTGEVSVIEFGMPVRDIKEVIKECQQTAALIKENKPFSRCFDDQEEEFNGNKTGNRRLPAVCGFCPHIRHCWPDAQLKPQARSKAKSPRMYWYSHYKEENSNAV